MPCACLFGGDFLLINISLVLTGLLISFLVVKVVTGTTFFNRKSCLSLLFKDGFLAVSSLHNAGYIPLLIMMSLPLGAWAGQVYTCVILSIIGFDTCLWSLGVWLLTRAKSSRMDLRKMINPPLISMSAAIIFSLIFGHGFIPETVLKPVKILGDAAMAVAMIVIGGNLSLSSLNAGGLESSIRGGIDQINCFASDDLGSIIYFKIKPIVKFCGDNPGLYAQFHHTFDYRP